MDNGGLRKKTCQGSSQSRSDNGSHIRVSGRAADALKSSGTDRARRSVRPAVPFPLDVALRATHGSAEPYPLPQTQIEVSYPRRCCFKAIKSHPAPQMPTKSLASTHIFPDPSTRSRPSCCVYANSLFTLMYHTETAKSPRIEGFHFARQLAVSLDP